jgi:chromosome segregation ATPase
MQMEKEILNKQRNLTEEVRNGVLLNQHQNIHSKIVQSQKELDCLAEEVTNARHELSFLQDSNDKEKSGMKQTVIELTKDKNILLGEIENLNLVVEQKKSEITKLNGYKKIQEDLVTELLSKKEEISGYTTRIIIENVRLIDTLKNKICDLQIEQNAILSENSKLSKEIEEKRLEIVKAEKEFNEWKLKSQGYSNQLKEIQGKEKEVDEVYSEVAAMHVRMEPEYIKQFGKFSNLKQDAI